MQHHLSRFLRHSFLLPSASTASSAAATFATARRVRQPKTPAPPAPSPEDPPKKAEDNADVSAAGAAETGEPSPREQLPTDLPRPKTIPYQPRVANSVNLVGSIGAPVLLQRMVGGRFSAVSVLVQDRRADFPKFWIPLIFQDDLAQVAACHLQENDIVCVSGQLNGGIRPTKISVGGQTGIQVLAQSLSFVDSKAVVMDVMMDEEDGFMEIAEAEKNFEQAKVNPKYATGTFSGFKNKQDKLNTLWNDFLTSPQDWNDYRAEKKNGSKNAKYPDFKHKSSEEPLWLNTAPVSVLQKLDDVGVNSGAAKENKTLVGSTEKEGLWQDVVDNPQNWWDNRFNKKSAKAPDFANKTSKEGLWLNTAPKWVLQKLDDVEFNSSAAKENKPFVGSMGKEGLWQDLVDNPNNWWDNRFNKKSAKAPDFSNKTSKEALWLNTAPNWVLPKLDDTEFNSSAAKENNPLVGSMGKEGLWQDLVENPQNWWDNRSNKRSAKGPDFTKKISKEALWLDTAPKSVLQKLDDLEFDFGAAKEHKLLFSSW